MDLLQLYDAAELQGANQVPLVSNRLTFRTHRGGFHFHSGLFFPQFPAGKQKFIPFSICISPAARPRGRSSCTAMFQSLSWPTQKAIIQQRSSGLGAKTKCLLRLIL